MWRDSAETENKPLAPTPEKQRELRSDGKGRPLSAYTQKSTKVTPRVDLTPRRPLGVGCGSPPHPGQLASAGQAAGGYRGILIPRYAVVMAGWINRVRQCRRCAGRCRRAGHQGRPMCALMRHPPPIAHLIIRQSPLSRRATYRVQRLHKGRAPGWPCSSVRDLAERGGVPAFCCPFCACLPLRKSSCCVAVRHLQVGAVNLLHMCSV